VQGIAAPADSRGRVVIFTNATGGVVSFANDSGTAANRLLTGTGADLQLDNNASVLLKYDTSVSKWRVIGSTGGGSNAITVEQTHSLSVGQAIRYDGTNYVTAVASAANTAEVIGVVSKVVDGDTFQFISSGEISGLTGLSNAQAHFLSDVTPGLITATEPTTVGSVSVPLGIAIGTTKLNVGIKRGVVVGGANLRTQIGLANTATTTIQDVSAYHGGSLSGWIQIAGTTSYKFHFEARFAKNGAGTDFLISPQYVGDTPPLGFSMSVTAAGLIQVTLPTIAGFVQANTYANFALNAPAVGTSLPLQIDGGLVNGPVLGSTSGIAPAAGRVGQSLQSQTVVGGTLINTSARRIIAQVTPLTKGTYSIMATVNFNTASGTNDAISIDLFDGINIYAVMNIYNRTTAPEASLTTFTTITIATDGTTISLRAGRNGGQCYVETVNIMATRIA